MVKHSVNILFTDGRITGIKSSRGHSCYSEAKAWRDGRAAELKRQGYEIKAFNITSLKA